MKHLKIICSILLLSNCANILAQVNLVPNPSFETYTTCPYDLGLINCTGNWYLPTLGSADYYDSCNTSGMGVPANWYGYQNAVNNGGGYIALPSFATDFGDANSGSVYREYVQTALNSTLVAGQRYYLSFYVSLADSSAFSADGMGAYVSQTPITLVPTNTTIPASPVSWANFTVTPQVSNPAGQLLTNTTTWTKISGAFTALGGEQYITIGNFKNNTNTLKSRRLPKRSPYGDWAYYYVDEVCLSLSAQTCGVSPNVGINELAIKSHSLYYNPNEEKIIFEDGAKDYFVTLTDLLGNQIKTVKVEQTGQMDVSEIKSGCYIIYVSDLNTESAQKIIIAKR